MEKSWITIWTNTVSCTVLLVSTDLSPWMLNHMHVLKSWSSCSYKFSDITDALLAIILAPKLDAGVSGDDFGPFFSSLNKVFAITVIVPFSTLTFLKRFLVLCHKICSSKQCFCCCLGTISLAKCTKDCCLLKAALTHGLQLKQMLRIFADASVYCTECS